MNQHDKIQDLLTEYVAGELTDMQCQQVEAHLEVCEDCREEVRLWQDVSTVMAEDFKPQVPPQAVLQRALEEIHRPPRQIPWLRPLRILRAQVPLVQREIWPASLLVMLLGFVVTIIADKVWFLYAMAPLVSAAGMAFLYGKEQDPAYELVLSTPVSQMQLVLARSGLVFGYNLVLTLVFSLGLSLAYSPGIVFPLVAGWLAPMTFLSMLGLFLSLVTSSGNAVIAAYFLWLGKFLAQTPEIDRLMGELAQGFLRFWQAEGLLYILSAALFAGMLAYLRSTAMNSRQLT